MISLATTLELAISDRYSDPEKNVFEIAPCCGEHKDCELAQALLSTLVPQTFTHKPMACAKAARASRASSADSVDLA